MLPFYGGGIVDCWGEAMKIQTKFVIIASFCAVCVFLMVMIDAWASKTKLRQAQTLRSISTITQRHMEADMMHDAIRGDVLSAILASKDKNMAADDSSRVDLEEHYQNFADQLKLNRQETLPDEIKVLFDEAQTALDGYYQAAAGVMAALDNGSTNVHEMLSPFTEKFKVMEDANESLSNHIAQWAQGIENNIANTTKVINLMIWAISFMTLGAAILVPVYARYGLFNPLNNIIGNMKDLASGNVNTIIAGLDREDEVGEIASTIKIFKDNLLDKQQLEQEQIKNAHLAEEHRKQALKEQEEMIKSQITGIIEACAAGDFTKRIKTEDKEGLLLQLSEGMNKIGEVCLEAVSDVKYTLKELADGNLTVRMEGKYQGIFHDIQEALNSTVDNLASMVNQIQEAAESISGATKEIASGSKDLSLSLPTARMRIFMAATDTACNQPWRSQGSKVFQDYKTCVPLRGTGER